MAQTTPNPPLYADSFCSWFGFWAQFGVLAAAAILGAWFGGHAENDGDYFCGLLLFVAAVLLAFMRLKHSFDGRAGRWGDYLLVDDMTGLFTVLVVFVVVALFGLFLAADAQYGALHIAGVALFVVSALAVFLSMKRVFDNLDRRPHP